MESIQEMLKSKLIEFKININKEVVVKVAAGSFLAFSLIYAGKLWLAFRFFKKRGIKTPKFRFIFGNLQNLMKNQSDIIENWTQEFGKTYGYYEGHTPILVTSDFDIIQEVYIKQFNNFAARKKLPLEETQKRKTISLIRASKNRWKRMRLIMNPTFSSAKIRDMGPLIVKCVDRLIKQLDVETNKEINFSNYLKRFTMDTIWNCAFGLDIDLQNNRNNEYFSKSENIFASSSKFTLTAFLSILFYELNFLIIPLDKFINAFNKYILRSDRNSRDWIFQRIDSIIEKRLKENISRKDYMQLLLEAQSNDFSTENDNKNLNELDNIKLDKKLTPTEVNANLLMFMLAGYETTSTALSYCSYVLATNQEEQQKLRDEIDSHFPYNSSIEPDTENVKDIIYLDNFIKEILRLYPIARVMRRCIKPTNIKGIDIPKGLVVRIDHMSIHHDLEIWGPTDPYKFDPSRHETKRNPMAYLGFGLGPRNCIGMKFALIEMKLALVNLIRKYEIHPGANTPKKLEYVEGIVRTSKDGISVLFKKRNFD